jgi:hypothetical protein
MAAEPSGCSTAPVWNRLALQMRGREGARAPVQLQGNDPALHPHEEALCEQGCTWEATIAADWRTLPFPTNQLYKTNTPAEAHSLDGAFRLL